MFEILWFAHDSDHCPCAANPGGLGKDFSCLYFSEGVQPQQAWTATVLTIVPPAWFQLTTPEGNDEQLHVQPEAVNTLRGMVKYEANKEREPEREAPPQVQADTPQQKLKRLEEAVPDVFGLIQPAMRIVSVHTSQC